jgi:hypothetical protein
VGNLFLAYFLGAKELNTTTAKRQNKKVTQVEPKRKMENI